MRKSLPILLALIFLGLDAFGQEAATPGGAGQSPTTVTPTYTKEQVAEILRIAEETRSPEEAEAFVDLSTVEDKDTSNYRMKILRSKGRRAHIEFLAPMEEKGRRMLAHGNRYWSTFPNSRRVVAISRREMIGNSAFALADVFQMDVENDYEAKVLREEKVNAVDTIVLELLQKHDEAPYSKIHYWVEKIGYFPIRAQFYSFSGKLIKTMTAGDRAEIAGMIRPKKLIMKDEVTVGRQSTWITDNMRTYKFPDHIFTKEYLQRQ